MPRSIWLSHFVCLFSACGWSASDADLAVIRIMRQQGGAQTVRILHREPVGSGLDLVVALNRDGRWWDEKASLGLFLQEQSNPSLIYKIAIDSGHDGGYFTRVERATATDVVLSCTPEKGRPGPNRKFVYDIRAKSLVKRVAYEPLPMSRIVASPEKAVLSGAAAIEYRPDRELPFRVLKSAPAEASVARPMPELAKRFPLPQSTYEEFSAARPSRVKDGYSRTAVKMNEAVGPWQMVNGVLWFAKTFYDGEGMTGVGGFGYFDVQEHKYRIYSPAEIRNWSASAILVEPEWVWLGLVHNGEWGSSSGGLLRVNRATQKADRFAVEEIVNGIARAGDRLVMATEFGAAVLDGDKLRRFFVDETTDGRLRMAEALSSPAER